jgi:hypothetical protein
MKLETIMEVEGEVWRNMRWLSADVKGIRLLRRAVPLGLIIQGAEWKMLIVPTT